MSRQRLVVLFGGASSEHEVSIRSAASVLAAVDRARFEPIPVGITRDLQWRHGAPDTPLPTILASGTPLVDLRELAPDVVFPVLHGPMGEDGTLQGLLEFQRIPYVGCGVLASAVCMDKVAQKQLIAAAAPEIPLVPWVAIDRQRQGAAALEAATQRIVTELGFPCFCKPANLGSSVGISKCANPEELRQALDLAARYDPKIVVERGVDAREIEVAVLGNGGPETVTSAPGEIELPPGVWYDYANKYVADVATYHIPAALPARTLERLQELALLAFRATGCEGLARVDFLVDRHTNVPYLNVLNTMPGFTSISMYPKLMEHAAIGFRELVTRLCELAQARFAAHASRSATP